MRVLTGRRPKMDPEEKQMIIAESEALREADEKKLNGDFKLIYPNESLDKNREYQ